MFYLRKFRSKTIHSSTYVLLPLLSGNFRVTRRTNTSNHMFTNNIVLSSQTRKFVDLIDPRAYQFKFAFCTFAEPILVQAHDPSQIALELINAIDEKRYDDAWKAYEKHMHMDGFPRKSDITRLITGLAGSLDAHWLNKAYILVELAFNSQRRELLERDCLIYLSYIHARYGLPILAANVLRKLITMELYPPLKSWVGVLGHLSQSSSGAFLGAELLMELGYLFKDNRVDPRKKSNKPLLSMKPDSFAFNIALCGCLLFGYTRKAEELLELMPRIGVKPNGELLVMMTCIYEKNGRIDEIKKLKRHVDEACGLGDMEFVMFYDCLLSCHLKFGDLDSATELILDMLRKANEAKRSLSAAQSVWNAARNRVLQIEGLDSINKFELVKSRAPSYAEFSMDRNFSRIAEEAKESLLLISEKLKNNSQFVRSQSGILHPTEKIYAKLVRCFLETNKISDLASFLVKVSKEEPHVSIENSAVVQVILACISLNLLDQAYDLLDEMNISGVRVGSSIYTSLIKAYCKENRQGEVESLLKDARKAGVQIDASCYESLIKSNMHCNNTSRALHMFKEMKESAVSKSGHEDFEKLVEGCGNNSEANLMSKLLEEMKYAQKINSGVHDWNNVIHFFCKRKLMNDAQKALNKMRALGHIPNAQTFHSLVTGYAAVGGKYTEVTDLWGEMKLLSSSSKVKFDQELLDCLLYCFVRGGFFLRAIEVIEMMEKSEMFIDKYKYRSLWLKYHKTMYKGKAPKVQTEAQAKRREAAILFKRWIGLT